MLTFLIGLLCQISYDKNTYQPPEKLPSPVNSVGWEDSPEINWEGNTLIYCYFPVDLATKVFTGKIRVTSPIRSDYTGHPHASDIYLAHKGQNWISTPFKQINTTNGLEGCANLTDGNVYFSRSYWDGVQRRGVFLYKYLISNTTPQIVPDINMFKDGKLDPANTADNPFYVPKSKRLYFEKQVNGNTDIFVCDFNGTTYKNIRPLGLNTAADETQLWTNPDETIFLFCRDHVQILLWLPQFTIPVLGSTQGIGEPSMDKNGNIYFLHVDKVTEGYDANIYMMRRK